MCMKENNENRTIQEDLNTIYQVVQLLDAKVSYLSERVAWSESCFRDVKDCGVIQLAEPLKASIEEVKRLKVQHQALSHRIKSIITMLEGQEEQEGGSDQAPQAQPSTLSKKYGR